MLERRGGAGGGDLENGGMTPFTNCAFKTAGQSKIKTLVKSLDIKRVSRIYNTWPKLTKLSTDLQTQCLLKASNISIIQNGLVENIKSASVILHHKGRSKKDKISNFNPVS